MFSHFQLIALCLLFGLVAGQPSVGNGRDRANFRPLGPPGQPAPRGRGVPPPSCPNLRIRELTGRCTTTADETFGEARRVHFSYFDVDSTTFLDTGLKSPRVISNLVADQEGNIFSPRRLNELLVFFGQFVDHNVVSTPLSENREEDERNIEPPEGVDEELPFIRSMRGPTGDGDGMRPINILTSVPDLVAVYGPSAQRNDALRVENSCKLKTSEGDLLPFNTVDLSNAPNRNAEFYLAGDTRSNEHPVLTSLHVLFVREHNFLCDAIAPKLPSFTSDELYEAARSINIAQFQKIVYEEFFPAITGRRLPRYRGFRSNVNPTLSSVFSTAAFRVGHTMIGDVLTKINADGDVDQTPLHDNFFVVENVGDGIDPFLRGAAQTRSQEIDVKVVDSLRNLLFDDVDDEEGPDLIALNLQRSRDHNIPSFNDIREEFGIRRARTFGAITSDTEIQGRLASAYDSVDDVEAWIGMMAEDKMRGSSMGRTLFAVWREEFLRLRDGDQFLYLREQAISQTVRSNCPDLVEPLTNRRVRLFRDLIVRNTDISESDLNQENIFNTFA